MKRMITASLFTLVLSTLFVPTAHALRPELRTEPIQETVSSDRTIGMPAAKTPVTSAEDTENKASMLTKDQQTPQEKTFNRFKPGSFEYFERLYLDRYGS